ncbi:hypothetical protein N7468_002232 [Penicillium chermesinum]|uniref:Developmental and secondary metabolism regulator veA n=1 Tax=Penicillium chermesinum TaxID=63820 RepID=A0A9W9PI42_9EURO|nr:uncharacterized protein N7468_002232 [Penicillium chermesinum]KAJ5247249.1 hypothetical protein N7468_002232 [Penicillium chermesinum]KAJ6145490.1 hypothetical protein N7470_009385 [Penicillium chermesinum]
MASRTPPNLHMGAPQGKPATSSRITRDNKKITYRMFVMQQPERARACGAGAKSSADRRPVDPPPVVELRIYESEPGSDKMTDITFAYNANFFLYATLETARPTAQGRMPGPPSPPVLTGVPVAGIAYLDRPSQAGYFIFPDLSVRHEGRYVLNFHLYEEMKDPKDADKDSSSPGPSALVCGTSEKPGSPQAFLNFRLEIKSKAFNVYSAKKFPGLSTSTSLSRVIAEQGCRVRIRRDVRMRRRGEKQDNEYGYDEGTTSVYTRSDQYISPDPHFGAPSIMDRARSNSNGSATDSAYPYAPDRRPSVPAFPNQRAGMSYLEFNAAPGGYPPAHQMPPTPPSHHPMYSPQPNYMRYGSVSEYDAFPQVHQYQHPYSKPPMHPYQMEPHKQVPYIMNSQSPYMMPHVMAPDHTAGMVPMPNSKIIPPEFANVHESIEVTPTPTPGNGYDQISGSRRIYSSESNGTKRTYDESFGSDDRSLQNGMRPDTDPYPAYRDFSAESRAALAELGMGMAYKRANGKMVTKAPSGI